MRNRAAILDRRRRIAACILAGKTLTQIAIEFGISRTWAAREAAVARQILAELADEHAAELQAAYTLAVDAVGFALRAKQRAYDKDARRLCRPCAGETCPLCGGTGLRRGCAVVLGPDHYARLTAAKRVLEFINAGRAAPKAVEKQDAGELTIDKVLAVLKDHGIEPRR
jgi:hypothetical protein